MFINYIDIIVYMFIINNQLKKDLNLHEKKNGKKNAVKPCFFRLSSERLQNAV